MSGPLEITVGPWRLEGTPGGSVALHSGQNALPLFIVDPADVGPLAEALAAFVVLQAEPPRPRKNEPKATECRSCRALIFWAVTPAGRKMPVDAGPTPDGTLVLSLHADGLHIDTWRADEPSHAAPRRRWTSHFATCTQADQHRETRR